MTAQLPRRDKILVCRPCRKLCFDGASTVYEIFHGAVAGAAFDRTAGTSLDHLLAFAFCVLDESGQLREATRLDRTHDSESGVGRPRACRNFFENALRPRRRVDGDQNFH
jgi:hypothetical protein